MTTEFLFPIILIVGGFLLMLAEIFILPGLITGVVGFCLVVWGIVYSYQHFGSTGAGIAIVSSLIAGIGIVVALVRMKAWQRFVLKAEQKPEEGYVAPDKNLGALLGQKGIAFTFLRPSGQVKIDGRKYDAVAEGSYVEKGTEVHVIGLSGQQLVVSTRINSEELNGVGSV